MDESEKRGALWAELRRMDRCLASLRERLARVEANQASTSKVTWAILGVALASWAHRYFGG